MCLQRSVIIFQKDQYGEIFSLSLVPSLNTTQYNTTQHNTIQYNTIQHNTIQHNTIQHNTTQHNTIQYNTIQYNTTQYNTIQHRIHPLRQPDGGVLSTDSSLMPFNQIYYCGIIDTLQPYNVRKKLEHNMKGIVYDKTGVCYLSHSINHSLTHSLTHSLSHSLTHSLLGVSVCPPAMYSARFLHFMQEHVVSYLPSSSSSSSSSSFPFATNSNLNSTTTRTWDLREKIACLQAELELVEQEEEEEKRRKQEEEEKIEKEKKETEESQERGGEEGESSSIPSLSLPMTRMPFGLRSPRGRRKHLT